MFCVKYQKIGQKDIFSKFWNFLVIWVSFEYYFWIPHLKIVRGTNFHENVTRQTQIININASLWYSKMVSFRKNKEILVQICNIHISVTIQVTSSNLAFFLIFTVWTSMSIFMVFWKHGFQAPIICPCLMWNFPNS